MRFSRTFALILVLMWLASPARASDLAGLKAAFDQALEYLSQKDLKGFLSVWDPDAVLFTRNRIYPIDRTKLDDREWTNLFEQFFDRIISAGYTKTAVEFRVVGDTGIVWGLTRFAVDQRYEAGFDQDTRLTAIFTRVDGDWKILHWNDSPLPEGRTPIVP